MGFSRNWMACAVLGASCIAAAPLLCGAATPTDGPDRVALAGKPDFSIGSKAPEISGKDVNGQPLKTSDFKGKVVVLDFWGDW